MRITVYRETANPVAGASGEQEALLRAVHLALEHLQPTESLWVERRNDLNEAVQGKDCLLCVVPRIPPRYRQLLEPLSSPPVVVATLEPRVAALELCRARIQAVVGPDAAKIEFTVRRAVASSTFERAARVAEEHPGSPLVFESGWLARSQGGPPTAR